MEKLSIDFIGRLFFEQTKNLTLKIIKGGDTNVARRRTMVENLQLWGPPTGIQR